jgi:hypothetical protein
MLAGKAAWEHERIQLPMCSAMAFRSWLAGMTASTEPTRTARSIE